jgi:hypothetical protein
MVFSLLVFEVADKIGYVGKNPVSVLMEYCTHKRLPLPSFDCVEMGAFNDRRFLWRVKTLPY